ncbi:MAG: 3-phosphoshikimate 1-carboxyvinyltransferase [Planctomycetes bacterium]|nr:3-phosphoshikimate 1-carboxyvinyltransferase [Planctomycetota bacterium]
MLLLKPKKRIDAIISVPGSKSLTNRALVASALAAGTSTLKNASFSSDSEVMCASLRKFGLRVTADSRRRLLKITGKDPSGILLPERLALNLQNCGTAMRFLTAYCCLLNGNSALTGIDRMLNRPIGRLVSALKSLGADVSCTRKNYPPVRINASGKKHGLYGGQTYFAASESSQFISAILLAAPYAENDTIISYSQKIPSQPYILMTLDVMEKFGVKTQKNGNCITVTAGKRYKPCAYTVEPDAGSANYFFAMAAASKGRIRVKNINRNSKQAECGFIGVLEKMGCNIKYGSNFIECAGPEKLKGVEVDMNTMPDSVPTLAAIAPFASSATRITNIANLRYKETDRIAAITGEMKKLGVKIDSGRDYISIRPSSPLPGTVRTYDDHRMAMSFAVLGTAAKGITIDDEKCVVKSFPEFFDLLRTL